MIRTLLLPLSLALCAGACSSTGASGDAPPDPARRETLLGAVKQLEGRWTIEGEGGPGETEFHVSSAGSAVREVMFPGSPHEMTNMYALDGNALVMTHYCAGGNQPRMRATRLADGRIAFEADGVSDLGAPDEVYMGEMTLVLVDPDHVEQHWRAFQGDQLDHEMVFRLTRAE